MLKPLDNLTESPRRHSEGALPLSGRNARLLSILKAAHDLSTGSEELLLASVDPYARLHFSPEGANLLRPFRGLLHGDALHVGAGSGTLTRFLGECGCRVDAVEADAELAAVAHARCSGLDNVRVVAGRVDDLPQGLYDIVAATEADPSAPLGEWLAALKLRCRPGGILITACDNILGVDAGESPREGAAQTRQELEEAFAAARFGHIRIYGLSPNCRRPRLIITPLGQQQPFPGMESLVAVCSRQPHSAQIWKAVLDGGLLPQLCPAFLILASDEPVPALAETYFACMYSTHRRRHFARQTLVQNIDGRLHVRRMLIFPDEPPPKNSICQARDFDEPYFSGRPYLRLLEEAQGWAPADLARWAQPWLDLLANSSAEAGVTPLGLTGRILPATFWDCIPANILVRPDQTLQPFDLEYEAAGPVPLHFVAFRGLFHSLNGVGATAISQTRSWRTVDLVAKVLQLSGLHLGKQELDKCIDLEAALQDAVTGVPGEEVRDLMLLATPHATSPTVIPRREDSGFSAQLFWKYPHGEYSEDNSARTNGNVSRERQLITLWVPPMQHAPDALRLDPCDRSGLVNLAAMRLIDAGGNRLWVWDGDRASLDGARTAIVFADSLIGENGTLAYCETADPSFELPVSRALLEQLRSGGRLELEIFWPPVPELAVLQRAMDAGGQQKRIWSLEAERRTLTRTLESQRAEVTETRRQLEAESAKTAELSARMTQLEQDRSALEEANTYMQRKLEESTRRVEAAEAEAARTNIHLQEQLDESARRLEEVVGKLSELERQRNILEGSNWALQTELRENRKHIEDMATQVASVARIPESPPSFDLRSDLAALAWERETAKRELEAMAAEVRSIQAPLHLPLEKAQLDIAEIRRLLQEHEKRIQGIYGSLTWRLLTALGRPITKLLQRKP